MYDIIRQSDITLHASGSRPLFATAMSYASVAAFNAPPPSEQPKPDPALLNTSLPTGTHVVADNDTAKVNTVLPDFKNAHDTRPYEADREPDPEDSFPSTESSFSRPSNENKRLQEVDAEGLYIWQTAQHYLTRPGVGYGILGLGMFPKS